MSFEGVPEILTVASLKLEVSIINETLMDAWRSAALFTVVAGGRGRAERQALRASTQGKATV